MKPFHLLAILCGMFSAAPLHAETGAPDDSQAPKLGSLVGRFLYDSDPPKPLGASQFDAIRLNTPLPRDNVGRVSGVEIAYREYLQMGIRPRTLDNSLLVSKDRGLANVIVFVTSADIPVSIPELRNAKPAVLQIKDGQFTPRVLAVAADHTLEIQNADAIGFGFHLQMFHNESVNFLVAPRSEKSLAFSNPEKTPLPFRSNHQIWATGFLLIHSNPYFAVSAPDGTFTISQLPPGRWDFRAWHQKTGFLKNWPQGRFSFEIKAGNNDLGNVMLSPDMFNK